MTTPIYLTDTYLFELPAIIVQVGQDDKGSFIILNQTIFYPQGGGQPSDQGFLIGQDFEFNIISVRNVEGEIRHYTSHQISNNYLNTQVLCIVDKDRRIINARYHTAAHLLGNIVEILYSTCKAIKGHSFPKEAYVEFIGTGLTDINKVQAEITNVINRQGKTKKFEIDYLSFEQNYYKLPYQIPINKAFRVIQIEEFLPVPCGGTHLTTIQEIGEMKLLKIKLINNGARISYELI